MNDMELSGAERQTGDEPKGLDVMGTNAIELAGVERQIGDFILGPLDLTIPRGSVVALVGNNGAGKTTLLDMVAGLGAPDSGAIRVLGLDQPRNVTAIKARVAYVNLGLDFSDWGTVGSALRFLRPFYRDWDQARCEDLMKRLRLGASNRLETQSPGERMKFLLLTALSRSADLFILDEPTSGLDIHAREVLSEQIAVLRQEASRTIVISTHEIDYLEPLSDHIVVLHRGRFRTVGRVDALGERYRMIDVLLAEDARAPAGLILSERSEGRARFLHDRHAVDRAEIERRGLTIVSETRVTLQELLLILTRED